MTQRQVLIQQIIALARLPDTRHRLDIERELLTHLEDLEEEARSQGHNETMIERIAAIRFGEPRQIAAAFASVYSLERWMRRAVACAILVLTSLVAVSLVVGTVQSSAAIWTDVQFPDVSNGLHWEILGLGAVALGYCSAYLGECLYPMSFAKSVTYSVILTLCIGAVLFLTVPAHAILSCIAFASAVFARLLQRVPVPLLWFAGTAGPLAIAGLVFRPQLSGQGPPSWLLWAGLTLSCGALRRVVYLFEKLIIGQILA